MRARVPSSSSSSSTTSSASRSSWRAVKFGLSVSTQDISRPARHLALVGELGADATRASRISSASSSDAASTTAAASRAADCDRAQRVEPGDDAAELGQRHVAAALADGRPRRDRRRAQRSAIALASVGTSRATASRRSSCVASSGPRRSCRPRRAARGPRRASARRRSPRRRPHRRVGVRRNRALASSTASASGLASPGSSPWASTSPPTSSSTIRPQPSSRSRVVQGGGDRARARVRVDEHACARRSRAPRATRRTGSRRGRSCPGPRARRRR